MQAMAGTCSNKDYSQVARDRPSAHGLRVADKQVVNDDEAARLAGQLHAGVAVPIHYAFRGGIISDTFVLSHRGTAEGFARAAKTLAPQTDVRILPPGQKLEILHAAGNR
jgi:L-ascorbate metabolism protein UlaG (beta-lactamase superfamily)